jgi:FkbH-like protein
MELSDLKDCLQEAIRTSAWSKAEQAVRSLWGKHPSASLAAWLHRMISPWRDHFCLRTIRVAFLRSFTVEPAIQLLQAAALTERIWIEPYIGPFNAYAQDLLNPESDFCRFQPELTFLSVLTRSIAPELWEGADDFAPEFANQVTGRVCSEFERLLHAFLQRSHGTLVIHTLELPRTPFAGIADAGMLDGQRNCVYSINRFLIETAAACPGIRILDYQSLITEFGAARWSDESRWTSIRLPISIDAVSQLADHWLKYVCASTAGQKKVLVCDLDNTLWHGVVGEDGFAGIKLGETGAGAPHRQLQRVIVDLSRRGILLAICSKNNHDDAWQVVEKHPDMLLRPEHFAAVRINWDDKPANLRSIAEELNVGLDSLVFLDDHPQERDLVRSVLPEVRVLDVGSDAAGYTRAVQNEPGFERLSLSQEDRYRGKMYLAQRMRKESVRQNSDLETWLHSLETVVARVAIAPEIVERVSQLTQKTNQFNLTTKRYSAGQIAEFLSSECHLVMAWRVTDRFGDHGIVGVAILKFTKTECEIDTFLLSCRVIGRGVESAMLFDIKLEAEKRHWHVLHGQYLPTPKNLPCADFYDKHGFQFRDDGWLLDCSSSASLQLPKWISLTAEGEHHGSRYAQHQ